MNWTKMGIVCASEMAHCARQNLNSGRCWLNSKQVLHKIKMRGKKKDKKEITLQNFQCRFLKAWLLLTSRSSWFWRTSAAFSVKRLIRIQVLWCFGRDWKHRNRTYRLPRCVYDLDFPGRPTICETTVGAKSACW